MATFQVIQDRVNRRIIDITPAVTAEVPDLINKAIRAAEDEHNFRAMKATVSFTTTNLTRELGTIPTDWKEAREKPWIRLGEDGVSGDKPIVWLPSEQEIVKLFGRTDPLDKGPPNGLFVNDETGNIEVYPYPDDTSLWTDGDHRVVVPYWKYLPDLIVPTGTNWFTDNMDWYITFYAAGFAFLLNWDEERGTFYAGLASNEFSAKEKVDKRSKLQRSGVLVPRRDVNAPKRQRRI